MKTISLNVTLLGHFTSIIGYDTDSIQVSASCSTEGWVEEYESDFGGRHCTVRFYRGVRERFATLASEHDLDAVCGEVLVSRKLEPEDTEADGIKLEVNPIYISIQLDDKDFSILQSLLTSSVQTGAELALFVCFTHKDFAQREKAILHLQDVDQEADVLCPVVSYEIRQNRAPNRRVLVPHYDHSRDGMIGLSFSVDDVLIMGSLWNSEFSISKIRLTGKISCPRWNLVSQETTVKIEEYETSQGWRNGYPDTAFPGSLEVSKEGTYMRCWATLYATRDALIRMENLLTNVSSSGSFRIDISAMIDGDELQDGDRKHFAVTRYAPSSSKSYVEEKRVAALQNQGTEVRAQLDGIVAKLVKIDKGFAWVGFLILIAVVKLYENEIGRVLSWFDSAMSVIVVLGLSLLHTSLPAWSHWN